MKQLGWVLCAMLGPPALHGAELLPNDFAFGSPVIAAKEASAYRIALPLALYQNTYRDDLADIRIFNAAGQVVPYSSKRKAAVQPPLTPVRLPLFSLATGARAVIEGVRVTIVGPASALNWQGPPKETGLPAIQYILDGREFDSAVAGLRLDWPETDLDYSGRIKIEASDDLNAWSTIVAGAPIVNLREGGRAIILNRVAFPRTHAKFWRLSWVGAPPPFNVASIFADPAGTQVAPDHAFLDALAMRDAASPQDVFFDLGAHLPVDRVNLLLPEVNTIVNVEMLSRRRASDPWRTITRAALFRVAAADGDIQNAPIEVAVDRDRYWRVRLISGGSFSQEPLHLRAQWIPDEVTFLARGNGPFLLAYGSSAALGAEVDLSMLPANIEVDAAAMGDSKVLGGPGQLKPQVAPMPRAQFALWGALLFAVAGLAWMASRLINERKAA
jgi:hypothetical protein